MRDKYVLNTSCTLFLILTNNNAARYHNSYFTYNATEAPKRIFPRSHNERQR